MTKIRIDPADTIFSRYIRTRDGWICQRCGNGFPEKLQGLHCSHYFGRGKESTRFDPENCDALCFGCHRIWGSDDRESYRYFKIKQLGEKGFEKLWLRSNMLQKKDRKAALLIYKKLLGELKRGTGGRDA